tara:strand:+ start:1150 stop:1407 length:258 start_codon:yes stop_codon:yes gene_type:complete
MRVDLNKETEEIMAGLEIMKIEKTKPRGMRIGKGYVLYGSNPHVKELYLDGTLSEYGKWVEKWYPTVEKAVAYCEKNNWKYEVIK